ncbi:tyrosyl-DNA phosphodiesterase 1-like [Paramacrobiotus metropolitanus]|uniref:tyrosyl-DNA phosphodiesterase 1-like n=1 Tax=Paramacrobiotus metropolitanus TaxID=2943436 RepID=UPI0024460B36|nr:tyrosyl-DNA phosphodiesterase 1-like [Paramacrobiotus metropolitanus]
MASVNGSLPSCPYGSRCYRQNPQHFKEFSHPADHQKHTSEADTPNHSSESVAGSSGDTAEPARKRMRPASPVPQIQNPSASSPQTTGCPLGIFLTTTRGLENEFNDLSWCRSMKHILAPDMGDLQASIQFNYMFDIPWIVDQYPPEFRDRPMMIVHGDSTTSSSGQLLRQDASQFPHITLAMARLPMAYGTHHTKMMILFYVEGVRVVVHTSNLISGDWNNKTQGMWISPVFPKSSDAKDSSTNFRRDLLEYLRSYGIPKLNEVADRLMHHDMSSANVFIVSSVPGRHEGEKKSSFGHLKLRSLLKKHCFSIPSSWPVIGQFSSIGSLGPAADKWLTGEFLDSLGSSVALSGKAPLKLVFPSVDNVRLSSEGWKGGGSLPYSQVTADKQRYLDKFLHVWKSDAKGRSHSMPHIKTYTRTSPELKEAAWLCITSANLSKAAWGALEKEGSQLMIRSYELGVVFIPHASDPASSRFKIVADFTSHCDNGLAVFLPYDLPLVKYSDRDRPWTWDAPQTGLLDRFGKPRK